MEGEGRRDTELLERKMQETSNSVDVSTKLQRIAELAEQDVAMVLVTLAHHIDVEFLKEAFRRTRQDGAPGVDGRTATEYEERLDENLQSLLDRFKSGRYKAPPVRRAHIPKGDGKKTRPIGIPTIEDKILQRAVTMVLETVYEPIFSKSSYGFRPGRSARQASQALWKILMRMRGGWVIEADIESFFDTLDHQKLRKMFDRRVRDGVLRRTIDKWLKRWCDGRSTAFLPSLRHAARRGRFTCDRKRLPSHGPRRMVRKGDGLSALGRGPPDPVCRRFRHGLS